MRISTIKLLLGVAVVYANLTKGTLASDIGTSSIPDRIAEEVVDNTNQQSHDGPKISKEQEKKVKKMARDACHLAAEKAAKKEVNRLMLDLAAGWSQQVGNSNNKQNGTITLYQHCNFTGYAVTLKPGRYQLDTLKKLGVRNDDVSSVKVSGNAKVKLYQHDLFRGKKIALDKSEKCLVGLRFNDVLSSAIVTN